MGLSGRKVKQRISADPRNLGWADDAARFGSNYLSKFGWDASKGLGADGDGMKSHIKVSHKLDMLGIGAAQTKDLNGIAWKQNRDFESLLQRLNENLQAEQTPAFDQTEQSAAEDISDGEKKKKKKRKHREMEEEDGSERKEKKKDGKDKKQREEESMFLSTTVESMQMDTAVETKTVEVQKVVALPRHRAHRARLIAAKNIASKSAAHISEILGIAPDAQAISTPTIPPEKLTSVTDTDVLGIDKLTTSTKSLADYFKAKLDARMGSSFGTSTHTATRPDSDDAYDAPRGGIGASRMHLEIQSETRIEEETQRVGLSKFSSLMSSSFLAATSSVSYVPPSTEQDYDVSDKDVARILEVESDSETKKKSTKKKKKREKRAKDTSEEDNDKVEERKEKKSKKDKKGKDKAVEEVEEQKAEVDTGEDEKKRWKKEKKKKKKKAVEETLKTEATEDDVKDSSHKKEKKKHQPEKSDTTSAEPEDSSKSKKEKKKCWTDL